MNVLFYKPKMCYIWSQYNIFIALELIDCACILLMQVKPTLFNFVFKYKLSEIPIQCLVWMHCNSLILVWSRFNLYIPLHNIPKNPVVNSDQNNFTLLQNVLEFAFLFFSREGFIKIASKGWLSNYAYSWSWEVDLFILKFRFDYNTLLY